MTPASTVLVNDLSNILCYHILSHSAINCSVLNVPAREGVALKNSRRELSLVLSINSYRG